MEISFALNRAHFAIAENANVAAGIHSFLNRGNLFDALIGSTIDLQIDEVINELVEPYCSIFSWILP